MARFTGAGVEDKRKVAIAAGLGVVVLALAFHTLFGGPSEAPPAAPARTTAVAPARGGRSAAPSAPTALDPALHPELMAETENYVYTGSGRNIFSRESAPLPPPRIEQVRAPVRPSEQPQVAVNTGPPPPPPIDLRFFGYSARKNGVRQAFFSRGDDVFVAHEGDIVGHRYRIISIAASSAQVEDLPYHNTQTLPLVQN